MQRPTLFVTMGDPAGVGPEVVCKALARLRGGSVARLVTVGSRAVLERAARWVGVQLVFRDYQPMTDEELEPGEVELVDLALPDLEGCPPGRMDPLCGEASYRYIEDAVARCRRGEGVGLVTAPINKAAVNAAGHHYAGHTEILAHLLGARDVAMLLATPSLRVSHVSTHCSLEQAIARVRSERIQRVARLTVDALRGLGYAQPRLAVAGLNPHAGEGGLFGDEEQRHIRPAVEALVGEGIDARGPEPPDTVFWRASRGDFDAVVAMYHDQGHIAVKMLGFSQGVNVTLGLPVVRTSVDHGTAFDIAGTGRADEGSLLAALDLASRLAEWRAGRAT
ncbi:MAG: 4-hydroxythreonine-4-phosphate dehydrogenase PdxA [Anaerolineae bacterium]|nr:4-hydroxythreonine-4-phosphate dehydrogenase PdxA [Anaerolineae bacterium]